MSYRFQQKEKLGHSFERIAREQLEGALSALGADSGERPDGKGIHEARRRMKKLRSLLRLMRPALGDELYRRENSAAREIGHELAPTRDAAVRLATLDRLLDGCTESEAAKAAPLRRQMAAENAKHDAAGHAPVRSKQAIGRLRALLGRIAPPAIDHDAELVCSSLQRTYRRARRSYAAAADDASDEALHTLRKRVKDLRYQLLLVKHAAPEHSKKLRKQLDRLGADLGEDHDLAVLSQSLRHGRPAAREACAALHEELGCRRCRLQRAALRLAKKIFAEKPSAWVKPYRRAWKRWHEPR